MMDYKRMWMHLVEEVEEEAEEREKGEAEKRGT